MKRKSILTATILAALFGPLGLFYVSGAQAIVGTVAWLVVVPGSFAASPETGGTVALVFWVLCMAVAWAMARERNQDCARAEAKEEQKHREILAALERAGQR